MNIVDELRKYYTNPANESKRKYIKGLTPTNNVRLENQNGVIRDISIEELKNGLFDFEKFKDEGKKEEAMEDDFEMIEELEESKGSVNESIEMIEVESDKPYTMQDLKNAVDLKDVISIDKILGTFAVNPNTGLVDIDRAIGIVTKNTTDLCISSINEGKKFDSELNKYSVDGKLISDEGIEKVENQNVGEVLDAGFNNILLLVEVAKQKGIVYGEENIQRAKKIFATQVKDKLNIKNLEKNENVESVSEPNNNVIDFEEKKNEIVERKSYVPTLKPDNNIKRAGFADIFILTIIVLVYTAIIINLIMKLK